MDTGRKSLCFLETHAILDTNVEAMMREIMNNGNGFSFFVQKGSCMLEK